MGFISILSFAHQLIGQAVQAGDTVIDATIGNGVDTVFLARTVGPRGRVHGFDIQALAVDKTRERLARELPDHPGIELHLRSHAEMKEVLSADVHGQVSAVMFNLGYLPGADHSTITQPDSTIPALEAALEVLAPRGIVTIAIYPGHEGGEQEAKVVEQWAKDLPQVAYQVLRYEFINPRNSPPYLIAIHKR